jgi:uncharacterized protein YecE (DUF72 family)
LMETRLKVLWPKAGPVLFQLPARFKADRKRLASFLKMLPKRYKYAFEFRDASWYEDNIFDVLRDRNVALCLSDHVDAPAPWEVTATHVYIRGHGPTGQYKDQYPAKKLREWAATIAKWKRRRLEVYRNFDNDQKSAAPKDARRLIELVSQSKAKTILNRRKQR